MTGVVATGDASAGGLVSSGARTRDSLAHAPRAFAIHRPNAVQAAAFISSWTPLICKHENTPSTVSTQLCDDDQGDGDQGDGDQGDDDQGLSNTGTSNPGDPVIYADSSMTDVPSPHMPAASISTVDMSLPLGRNTDGGW